MERGRNGTAFRAQLVVPEQRLLYDYWLGRCVNAALPARADINPADIARLLPGISLIEVASDIGQCRVRLAGTRLREIYDREITGLHLCDLAWGGKADYWTTAYQRTITQGLPTQGVVRGPQLHKEHVVQYWLKLPLRTTSDAVSMVLCYDYFIPASELVHDVQLASA